MTKYTSAARTYGESVLYVVVATVLAPQMSSVMPSTEQMDDSFTIVTSSLASAGRMFLIACGSTTSFMLCHELRPSERAASFCPPSTARMPARMISATYAEELSASATTPGMKRERSMKPRITTEGILITLKRP